MSDRNWRPIKTAPHDRPVYLKCEDGATKMPMSFTPPCWWDAPHGQLRLADDVLCDGTGILKATHWTDRAALKGDDNAQ